MTADRARPDDAAVTNYINGAEVAPALGSPSELDVVNAIRAAQRAHDEWARARVTDRAARVRTWIASVHGLNEHARAEIEVEIARAEAAAREPIGVVGVILPRVLVLRTLLPWAASLLTCGNTLVTKPSSRGADEVRGLFTSLGTLPAGVCNIVFGAREPVGRFLVEHPGVPAIAFAGSSESGRRVMAQAAPQLKRLMLSLGAKNAAIVLKDADLDRAAHVLSRAAFAHGGVDPYALGKILVQQDVFDDFAARFAAQAPPWLDTPAAFDHWIELARREDGKVTGGHREGGRLSPAIVRELTNCSEIHQTELLGPLVTLNSVKYPAEGVKWANTSPYGRAGAVWTANVELGRRLAKSLIVGTAWVNGWRDHAANPKLGHPARASAFGVAGPLELGTRATVVVG